MTDDSWFYAGLAGGRANTIRRQNETIDEWANYAANLERRINYLERVSEYLYWYSINARASARVAIEAFEETNRGQFPREYLGAERSDRRFAYAREAEKKDVDKAISKIKP